MSVFDTTGKTADAVFLGREGQHIRLAITVKIGNGDLVSAGIFGDIVTNESRLRQDGRCHEQYGPGHGDMGQLGSTHGMCEPCCAGH